MNSYAGGKALAAGETGRLGCADIGLSGLSMRTVANLYGVSMNSVF
jgi:hypothetical protein